MVDRRQFIMGMFAGAATVAGCSASPPSEQLERGRARAVDGCGGNGRARYHRPTADSADRHAIAAPAKPDPLGDTDRIAHPARAQPDPLRAAEPNHRAALGYPDPC